MKKIIKKKMFIIVSILIILDLLSFNFIVRAYISYQEIFVKSYIEKTSKTNEYKLVLKSFRDTLNNGFNNVMVLNSEKVNYDIIIFNKDKSKGLIYNILMYDKDSKFDYIEPIGFIKLGNNYIFNSGCESSTVFSRNDNNNLPYSIATLKEQCYFEIAISKFIKTPLGLINHKIIDTEIESIKELVELYEK